MADFNIRSDSVDVEQIMQQIRARISEKRGVDYTEEQVRELATVRLERFLDPKNLRSDLIAQFRGAAAAAGAREPRSFRRRRSRYRSSRPTPSTSRRWSASHRGGLRFIRQLLRADPEAVLELNTLHQVLHRASPVQRRPPQARPTSSDRSRRRERAFTKGFYELKRQGVLFERSRAEWNILYYEVLHNLVLETTRNAIERQEPQDARRSAGQPPRLQRAPRASPRRRGAVPARGAAPRAAAPMGASRHDPPRVDGPAPVEASEGSGGESAEKARRQPGGLLTPSESRRRRRRRRGRRPGGPEGRRRTRRSTAKASSGEGLTDADAIVQRGLRRPTSRARMMTRQRRRQRPGSPVTAPTLRSLPRLVEA